MYYTYRLKKWYQNEICPPAFSRIIMTINFNIFLKGAEYFIRVECPATQWKSALTNMIKDVFWTNRLSRAEPRTYLIISRRTITSRNLNKRGEICIIRWH